MARNCWGTRGRFVLALCLLVAGPTVARAVSCPSGTYVEVCIKNPTTGWPVVTVSGSVFSPEATCGQINGVPATSYTANITLNPGGLTSAEQCTTVFTALVSGMFVHQISAASGQLQYQRVPVLNGSGTSTSPRTRVHWTYFPNVVTVNTAGDSDTNCSSIGSGGNYNLRQAINKANSLSTSTLLPVLIKFSVSPGDMQQDCALTIAGNGYITVDATDSSGKPWIVGDASATQDNFSRVVDLKNVTAARFQVTSSDNTVLGLYIKNTQATGANQAHDLIEIGGARNVMKGLKLDGGYICTPPACAVAALFGDLIDSQSNSGTGFANGLTVRNTEGLRAQARAVEGPFISGYVVVKDSWLHHNTDVGVRLRSGGLEVHRNVIELTGRSVSDNGLIWSTADGVTAVGVSGPQLVTNGNINRMNTRHGMRVDDAVLTVKNDYLCGNSQRGVESSARARSMTVRGVGGVYNASAGVYIDSYPGGTTYMDFGNSTSPGNNAFAQNAGPYDFINDRTTSGSVVDAISNQWGPIGLPRVGGSGTTNTSPVQDPVTAPIMIDAQNPMVPSNVFLVSQTIRVQGSGFNAIAGNPAPDANCDVGFPSAPKVSCCLTRPAAANTCDTGTHNPFHDGTNCVELQDATGAWTKWGRARLSSRK